LKNSIPNNLTSFLVAISLMAVQMSPIGQPFVNLYLPSIIAFTVAAIWGVGGSYAFFLSWLIFRFTVGQTIEIPSILIAEFAVPLTIALICGGRIKNLRSNATDIEGYKKYLKKLESERDELIDVREFLKGQVQTLFTSPTEILSSMIELVNANHPDVIVNIFGDLLAKAIPRQRIITYKYTENDKPELLSDSEANEQHDIDAILGRIERDIVLQTAANRGEIKWRMEGETKPHSSVEILIPLKNIHSNYKAAIYLNNVHFLNCNQTTLSFISKLLEVANGFLDNKISAADHRLLDHTQLKSRLSIELEKQREGTSCFKIIKLQLNTDDSDVKTGFQVFQWKILITELVTLLRNQDLVGRAKDFRTYYWIIYTNDPSIVIGEVEKIHSLLATESFKTCGFVNKIRISEVQLFDIEEELDLILKMRNSA